MASHVSRGRLSVILCCACSSFILEVYHRISSITSRLRRLAETTDASPHALVPARDGGLRRAKARYGQRQAGSEAVLRNRRGNSRRRPYRCANACRAPVSLSGSVARYAAPQSATWRSTSTASSPTGMSSVNRCHCASRVMSQYAGYGTSIHSISPIASIQ